MVTPPPTAPPPTPPDPPSLCYIWLSRQIPDVALCCAADRLHQLQVRGRWLFNGLMWLLLLPPSLWSLYPEYEMLRQAFTWVGLRYSLMDHPWATLGLLFPLASTLSTLIWQSRNILFGLPQHHIRTLEKQACRIQAAGASHVLWGWVWGTDPQPLSRRPHP